MFMFKETEKDAKCCDCKGKAPSMRFEEVELTPKGPGAKVDASAS